jgi:TonB family protein
MISLGGKISIIAAVIFSAFFLASGASGQTFEIAVLSVGETGRKFHDRFRAEATRQNSVRLIDEDLGLSAMRALNYKAPSNLSLKEAKNLGAAIDCEFFFVVKSDTVRRSSFKKDVYFESYANIFLVSARTGRLLAWENSAQEADKFEDAEKHLLREANKITARFFAQIQIAAAREREERAAPPKISNFLEIFGETAENENIRTPLPYKSLKPAYTDAAARFEIEAAVEAAVDLNAAGGVENVEIIRWAGFGLDEETIKTIKKMQFRPALRNGSAIPVRFVLRYNFRRPREKKD